MIYSSTAFLDCLRHSVPIVSFGWHDFSYKKNLERYQVFYFAENLQQLHSLVNDGVVGLLAPFRGNLVPFLAENSEQRLCDHLAGLLQEKPTSSLVEQ